MSHAHNTPTEAAAPGGAPLTVRAPAGAPRGGVVVVHDARGITPYLRSVCERLAAAGWLAAAPHLYHRQGIAQTPAAGGWPTAATDMLAFTGAEIAADVDAALAYLGTAGVGEESRAIIGFCMGGTVALATATRAPLAAAVSFYGGAVSAPYWDGIAPLVELAPALRGPWLGLYGEEDALITLAEINALREAAAKAPVPTELVSYPGAGHAFHSDDRASVHRPEAAADAWSRALAFLDEHAAKTA
ncbi:dienelactone hydrolase family protein [Pseudofrankia sp. BMG5.36]|uniref:dienelactone hydrolase family protein n=1 Tax=Pseudofrankia sp. BMG5.36 TaxID=1834512 RepID=UPI0008D900B9|nr:dienelactone hydrolase family protein [Pseudofrankia sp. BMG5.36]OHV50362.1 carboxymethylenebutenolidase [Pseudofrankia sp. BMG5.36]